MKPQDYVERRIEIVGWPVNLTSYKLGNLFYCKVDNVSPGAWLARSNAPTREEAEQKALDKAKQLLSGTRRQAV